MTIAGHVLVILVSCAALWLGATWMVDSAARIARKFGVSDLVIGLTVVAFGTSAPEFAVTIRAAIDGNPEIAMGNVIGSNIFNIGVILGVVSLFMIIQIKSSLIWRDGMVLLASIVVLLIMLCDGHLARWEGGLLTVGLIGYLLLLFCKKDIVIEEEFSYESATWKDGPLFLLGLTLITGGGVFMVKSAELISAKLGMSQFLIAMTVVAIGTSVPEFAISMVAIIKKHHGISAGNLIGSNIFNVLGVLGVAGVIEPLSVANSELTIIAAQLGLTIIVLLFIRTGFHLVRLEGVVLIIISFLIWGYKIISDIG
jgi:cation:H+ antiporter